MLDDWLCWMIGCIRCLVVLDDRLCWMIGDVG